MGKQEKAEKRNQMSAFHSEYRTSTLDCTQQIKIAMTANDSKKAFFARPQTARRFLAHRLKLKLFASEKEPRMFEFHFRFNSIGFEKKK